MLININFPLPPCKSHCFASSAVKGVGVMETLDNLITAIVAHYGFIVLPAYKKVKFKLGQNLSKLYAQLRA